MPFFRIAQTAILAGKEPNKLQGTCTLIIYTPVHCVKLTSQQLQEKDIHTGMSSSVLDDSCISCFRGITRMCLGATGLTSRKATACQSKNDSLVSSKRK